MFNIHDLAGLNQHPGIFLQDYANMFSSQANMLLNAHHHQSPGMYQGYYGQGQGQGQQSLSVHHVSSDIQNASNDHLKILYHNFAIRCTGPHNSNMLSSFRQALSIYLQGGSLC